MIFLGLKIQSLGLWTWPGTYLSLLETWEQRLETYLWLAKQRLCAASGHILRSNYCTQKFKYSKDMFVMLCAVLNSCDNTGGSLLTPLLWNLLRDFQMLGYQRSSCPQHNKNRIHPQTPSLCLSFVSLSLCFCLIKSCLLISRAGRASPLSGREQQQLPWGMVAVVVVAGLVRCVPPLSVCGECKWGSALSDILYVYSEALTLSLLSHSLPQCLSSHLSQGPAGTHTILHLCLNHDNKVHLALSCHTHTPKMVALLHYRHADYLWAMPDCDHADHVWFFTKLQDKLVHKRSPPRHNWWCTTNAWLSLFSSFIPDRRALCPRFCSSSSGSEMFLLDGIRIRLLRPGSGVLD